MITVIVTVLKVTIQIPWNMTVGVSICKQMDFRKVSYRVLQDRLQVLRQMVTKEVDYFKPVFTVTLKTTLVSETKRYAREKIQTTTPLQQQFICNIWAATTIP